MTWLCSNPTLIKPQYLSHLLKHLSHYALSNVDSRGCITLLQMYENLNFEEGEER